MKHHRVLTAALLLVMAVIASADIFYDFEQAFFVEDYGVKCKDHTLIYHEGLYHLYFIQGYPDGPVEPLGLEQWLGHATSPDLSHWTRLDSILPVVPGTWENGFIWAPHVIEDPTGGWLMFYTGADSTSEVRQQTGLAWSDDLYNWTRLGSDPIYQPGSWTDWADPLYQYANCRDPYVFQAPGDTLYYMLNTVRAADGRGAVDLAVSEDLHTWAHQDTFSYHSSSNIIESATIWEDEAGKWHFFFTEQNYAGTYHTVALDPFGPFWPGAAALFDVGYGAEVTYANEENVFSRYARVVLLNGDRYFIRFDEMVTPAWGGDWPSVGSMQGYRDWWTPQFGTAFDHQPTWGDNPLERGEESSNMDGNSYLSTLELFPYPGFANPGRSRGNGPTGLVKSDPFVLDRDRLSMMVGGGDQDSTCFVAMVRDSDFRILFRETGADAVGMDLRLWNTESLIGETVFLVVADLSSIPWGWISTDLIQDYDRVGDDPTTPSDPMVDEIYLGDVLTNAGVEWNCDFYGHDLYGSAPHYVIFTDATEGLAETYEWDFENDGIYDKLTQDAAHSFQDPGLYSVKLRVVNDLGMEAVELKENYIMVLENESNCLVFPSKISSGLPTPVFFAYSGVESLFEYHAVVNFDSTIIRYDGLSNWNPGKTFIDSIADQSIYIDWVYESGVDPILPSNDPSFLFGLAFTALTAVDTTQLNYVDSLCVVLGASGDTLQNIGWVDDPPFGEIILDVNCLLTGQVDYYTGESALPGVVFSMGPPNDDAVSNMAGEWEFEPYPMDDYTLRIGKDDELYASNSLDAMKVLRHEAGLELLTGDLTLRCGDVNLDEVVDTLDAVAIAEAAALIAPLASGDWAFEPDSVVFEPLNRDENISVVGMRMGDVDGSWLPGITLREAGESGGRQAITLSVPDTTLSSGTGEFLIPLLAEGFDSISALSLRLDFSDSILTYNGVSSNLPGLNLMTGELGGDIHLEWFDGHGGDSLLTQQGDTLLFLHFTSITSEWAISHLDFQAVSALGDSIGDAIEGVTLVDGSITVPGFGVDADTPPPASFGLQQNFPNPFNPSTEIRFSLAEEALVSLRIYDLEGRLVDHLLPGVKFEAGRHGVVWNGTDRRGRQVSSGMYFYRLDTKDFSDRRKMMLLK